MLYVARCMYRSVQTDLTHSPTHSLIDSCRTYFIFFFFVHFLCKFASFVIVGCDACETFKRTTTKNPSRRSAHLEQMRQMTTDSLHICLSRVRDKEHTAIWHMCNYYLFTTELVRSCLYQHGWSRWRNQLVFHHPSRRSIKTTLFCHWMEWRSADGRLSIFPAEEAAEPAFMKHVSNEFRRRLLNKCI